jgi:hypothetical protein
MQTITALVVRAIGFCARYAWPVIAVSIALTILSSWYAATHFTMTTDVNQLISPNIPWRQREATFEKAFPQYELIVAVIDAPTPELADEATGAMVQRLSQQKQMFRSIEQPKGGSFFAQSGLLFESVSDLTPQMKLLTQAQRLVQVLAGDPTLRGVVQVLQFGLLGVQGGELKLDQMSRAAPRRPKKSCAFFKFRRRSIIRSLSRGNGRPTPFARPPPISISRPNIRRACG